MDLFFRDLLEKEQGKTLVKIYGKKPEKEKAAAPVPTEDAYKSRMEFVLALEQALAERKARLIPAEDILDEKIGVILSAESIADTLKENPEYSILQLQKLLNERIQKRIAFLMTEEESTEKKKAVKMRYKGYFKMEKAETDILKIYGEFLEDYAGKRQAAPCTLPQAGSFHVYDLAALVLIWKRVTAKTLTDEYAQIIIDEAQDFGTAVYYVLKQVLSNCHYTIMGDVSQNINYETGMNSWEEVRANVFAGSGKASMFFPRATGIR